MTPAAQFLAAALNAPIERVAPWVTPMRWARAYADLSTVDRLSRFLGQIGHESNGLRWVAELWGPTAQQSRYEPVTGLSVRLGNTSAGDGRRYSGHGPIQVTGRYNHARVRDRLRARLGSSVPDFEEQPLLLCTPLWGALSAADYWVDRGLNRFADAGDDTTLTIRINGGTTNLGDRLTRTALARAACVRWGV